MRIVTILQKVRIEVKMLFIKCCLKLKLKALVSDICLIYTTYPILLLQDLRTYVHTYVHTYIPTYISMLSPSTLVWVMNSPLLGAKS